MRPRPRHGHQVRQRTGAVDDPDVRRLPGQHLSCAVGVDPHIATEQSLEAVREIGAERHDRHHDRPRIEAFPPPDTLRPARRLPRNFGQFGHQRHCQLSHCALLCHCVDTSGLRVRQVGADAARRPTAQRLGGDATGILERLRSAEERYRRLAENAPDIVFRYELSPQRRFVYVSPMIVSVTGYSPEEHYADPDISFKILHPDDHHFLESLLRGDVRKGGTVTMKWVHKNGNIIWIEQRSALVRDPSGQVIAIEGIARDISERRQLEEQLRHSQKMDAIGRLTAGVAHDFNNLLTVINGYSDLSLREIPASNPVRKKINEVKKAGDQAAALTRQLLAFGRKQVSQSKMVDVNSTVRANLNILRRVIGEDIELVTVLDAALRLVRCDEGQIEQVLLNLAVNSRDAMTRGGKLTIQTTNASTSEAGADQIMLSVTDTGCGMDAATQLRIFEPFFTTKESGRGTGLGLSIVWSIVKQNGGKIELDTKPEEGTSFRIYLPSTETATPTAADRTDVEARTGSETILVVEDDAAVRQFICTILQDAGYRVLTARHGEHALEIWHQHEDQFGLVVTDLVMPHMSGPVLIEKLRRLSPEVRVLYTSGYADDAVARHGDFNPEIPFIRKPFTAESFLQKVREALDAPIAYQEL